MKPKWETVRLYDFKKSEVVNDTDLTDVLSLLRWYEGQVNDKYEVEISITNIKSVYYQDYDAEVDFTVTFDEGTGSIDLFALLFKHGRTFPLHISHDDDMILCKNINELEKRLTHLFQTEFQSFVQ